MPPRAWAPPPAGTARLRWPVSDWLRELRAQWEDAAAHLDVEPDEIRRWIVGDSGGELFDSTVSFGPGGAASGVELYADPGPEPRLALRAAPEAPLPRRPQNCSPYSTGRSAG